MSITVDEDDKFYRELFDVDKPSYFNFLFIEK